MNGSAGRPADNPAHWKALGVYHRTVPESTVRAYLQSWQPIRQWFGLDPDPDLKWLSGTVANTTYTVSIVDLLWLHSCGCPMSRKVIFRMNGKKGNKNDCGIWMLWSNRRVDVSESQIYWPFHLVARIVCKMCLVWTGEWRDNLSSKLAT